MSPDCQKRDCLRPGSGLFRINQADYTHFCTSNAILNSSVVFPLQLQSSMALVPHSYADIFPELVRVFRIIPSVQITVVFPHVAVIKMLVKYKKVSFFAELPQLSENFVTS